MVGVGFYGGFLQVGVGFLLMASMRRLLKLDLVRVNMHKVFIVLIYTLPALLIFMYNRNVDWVYGLNLAAGGAWSAARSRASAPEAPYPGAPTAASMTGPGMGSSVGYDWLGTPAAMERGVGEPPLPDDGDPTREDRSFAVTQAMEEIERSQGVTIIDIEPETQEALAREVAATTRVEETEDEADTNADETEDEDEIEEAGAADTADDADAPPEESAEPTDPLELPDRRQDADGGNDGPAGGHSGSYDWRGRPIG